MAASLTLYHAALDAFMANPTEDNKRSVLAERAKLPDNTSIDGFSGSLPNIATLKDMLSSLIATATQTRDRRRFIKTQVSHGSS